MIYFDFQVLGCSMTLTYSVKLRFSSPAPWTTYRMDRFKALDKNDLEKLLYPLLRADDRPTAEEMLKAVSPLLATVLDHTREGAYLDAIASGRYQPELLFPKRPEIVERIRQHPALLWKASNVAENLSKSKKRP
jgi:hypothetical protein